MQRRTGECHVWATKLGLKELDSTHLRTTQASQEKHQVRKCGKLRKMRLLTTPLCLNKCALEQPEEQHLITHCRVGTWRVPDLGAAVPTLIRAEQDFVLVSGAAQGGRSSQSMILLLPVFCKRVRVPLVMGFTTINCELQKHTICTGLRFSR